MRDIKSNRTIICIAIQHANDYVPEIIVRKLQQVASENNVQTFDLILEREIAPLWDQIFPLPRNARAWFYDGGGSWMLFSDGELFAEPLIRTSNLGQFLPQYENIIWVVTLDDAAEHLRVSQCILSMPGHQKTIRA